MQIPKEYRINNRIRVPEVRVIDEKGKQLGVLPSGQAVQLADSKGLDLVEVSDTSVPPVCRIMDYGKFRYQLTRRERNSKKEHKASSVPETKEVRFKTRIGEHDRQSKARQVSRMLKQGAKVKISVMFRGREITHPEIGMNLLRSVAEDLADDAMLEKPPGFEGRFLSMVLAPQKSGSSGSKNTKGVKEVAKDKNT